MPPGHAPGLDPYALERRAKGLGYSLSRRGENWSKITHPLAGESRRRKLILSPIIIDSPLVPSPRMDPDRGGAVAAIHSALGTKP